MTPLRVLPFVVLFALHRAGAQDPCLTPRNRRGQCINIRNCQPLVDILRRPRPLPQSTLDFLINSQCGFEGTYPKVCCDTQSPTLEPITEPTPVPTPDPTPQTAGYPDPPDVTNHPNLRLLDDALCGPVTQSKIFGGNKTGIFDYPWMALLGYRVGNRRLEYRCGGSVINKRYILTAAHCVTQLPAGLNLVGVRVGDHDLSKERDCQRDEEDLVLTCAERYQDFGVESVHFHPGFTTSELKDDIALIRLNDNVDFRPSNARPICLPRGDTVRFTQKKAIVTGWGATELGPRSQDLLQVLLALVPLEKCQEVYNTSATIWYKQMCAGGEKNMDSCLGDSGGPLQVAGMFKKGIRFIQHGIVSYGLRNCGTKGYPGVYTRVAYYMDWILNTIRE